MSGDGGGPNREELLRNLSHDKSKRRAFLQGTLSTLFVGGAFARSSAAKNVDRDTVLTAARKYYSEAAIRESIQQYADDLLVELSEQGYLDVASANALPVGKLLSAEAYADATEGAMVFAIQKDQQPAPRIELTKRLPENQKLILVIRPKEERAYAVVKPTKEALTFGDVSAKTITTRDDECPGCYEDCECYAGCGPYDNCTCYLVCQSNCDCCYTDGSCSGCRDEYSC